jgi:hypothetical protein
MNTHNPTPAPHACGPASDAAFFADVSALMQKHPHLAGKYHIVCTDHETGVMKVDFKQQGGLRHIDGQTVTTEYKPRAELQAEKSSVCCEWECPVGKPCECVTWWVR